MKISVITMTYHNHEQLLSSARSVLSQEYEDLEYIVVDGGCDEETRLAIEKIRRRMEKRSGSFLSVSEPDRGLYDALNKGIRMASGDLVGLMCDRFADARVLGDMARAVEAEGADGVHGDLNYVQGRQVVRSWRMGQGSIEKGWMPGHPTLYLKKEIYDKYGLYRTDLKIAADYEFMVRILSKGGVRLAYLPRVLVYMDHGGDSASTGSLKNYVNSFREARRALAENGVAHPTLITLRRTLKVLLQFLGRK